MRRWKWAVVGLALVGGCGTGAWYGLRQIPASFGYGILVECESLPPDDAAIERWLKAQPGVVPHTVSAQRGSKTLHLHWIMTQSIGPREPPLPDLRLALEQFGYSGAGPITIDPPGKP